nr:hypothetical protein CFP56_07945 [Quercus suber]
MTSPATPFLKSYRYVNVTPFGLRLDTSQEDFDINQPQGQYGLASPHGSSHQPRSYRRAAMFDASLIAPGGGAKRTQSSPELHSPSTLSCESPDETQPKVPHTVAAARLPPLLPPSSSSTLQTFSSPTSPSLSSTISTLQSTPTHTPVQHSYLTPEQWRSQWDFQFAEPIRTKRKFNLKRAKRLPLSASGGNGEGVWQVHAAVIDLCGVDVSGGHIDGGQERSKYEAASAAKQDRSVRFTGIKTQSDSEGSYQEKETTGDSSFTLSKFKFPEAPAGNWVGSAGELPQSGIG